MERTRAADEPGIQVPAPFSRSIKVLLAPVIRDYAQHREDGERFGDFVIRQGYVKATINGLDFHADVVLPEPAAKK